MECFNCHELVEEGARYCGNCGQRLSARRLGGAGIRGYNSGYTLMLALRHTSETTTLMSVLCGLTGLAGAFFVPVLGLTLGVAGLVFGTISKIYLNRLLRIIGLAVSALAVVAGLATWTYAVRSDPRVNSTVTRAKPADSSLQAAAVLSTPCYSLSFVDELNVSRSAGNCDVSAFNGRTAETSTNAYKVYASSADIPTANDFNNLAKSAVEKDVRTNIPGYKVSSEQYTSFAGSPAFVLTASDASGQVSMVEAVVMHKSPGGKNIFVIVHANTGTAADLQILESQWQWK